MPHATRTPRPLSTLAIGDFGRTEFRGPRAMLDRFGRVIDASSLAEAIERLSGDAALDEPLPAIDVVVLAQGYPGCFAAAHIERLRRTLPTARFVALLGSWCEGEGRSGHPPPGVIRLYWHQWAARAESELRRMAAGKASTWSLPLTAGDDEPFLVLADEPLPQGKGRVVVAADEFDMREWLADALRAAGFTPADDTPCDASRSNSVPLLRQKQCEPPRGTASVEAVAHENDEDEAEAIDGPPAAVVYDAHWALDRACEELRRLAARYPQAPIVALVEFPRQDELEPMLAAGASAAISKPLVLADLLAEVARLTDSRGNAEARRASEERVL